MQLMRTSAIICAHMAHMATLLVLWLLCSLSCTGAVPEGPTYTLTESFSDSTGYGCCTSPDSASYDYSACSGVQCTDCDERQTQTCNVSLPSFADGRLWLTTFENPDCTGSIVSVDVLPASTCLISYCTTPSLWWSAKFDQEAGNVTIVTFTPCEGTCSVECYAEKQTYPNTTCFSGSTAVCLFGGSATYGHRIASDGWPVRSCNSYTDCAECLELDSCTWCLDSSSCIYYQDSAQCADVLQNASFCPVDCAIYGNDCQSCLTEEQGSCSFCLDTQTCSSTNDESCPHVVTNPNYCPGRCDYASCSTCVTLGSPYCEFCIETQTCMAVGNASCPTPVIQPAECPPICSMFATCDDCLSATPTGYCQFCADSGICENINSGCTYPITTASKCQAPCPSFTACDTCTDQALPVCEWCLDT
eukprot:TRINITY_DN3465_c0_g1_i3.p1 TRINITY_DN3465_c0_g1~~TRINITY_DN3465_c0_g1_i3.p1  ORF type:complete len:418 (-),score=-98.62 TRINITY_DN3465_c0_g1_i3:437-1690(-)